MQLFGIKGSGVLTPDWNTLSRINPGIEMADSAPLFLQGVNDLNSGLILEGP
jgi:hypothetical protein